MSDVTLRAGAGPGEAPDVDLSTALGGLDVPDPVFTASGCAAAGRELAPFNDLPAIGGVVTKSILLAPRSGRPTPRMAETPSGMLNSIGLQGPGIDAFLDNDLAWLGRSRRPGRGLDRRVRGRRLRQAGHPAARPARRPARGQHLLPQRRGPRPGLRLRPATRRPRSSRPYGAPRRPTFPSSPSSRPDVTDIVAIARSCVDAGADGLSLINTTLGMVIDTDTMRPALGGRHRRAVRPGDPPAGAALRLAGARALPDVPIMGIGGIRTGLDAFEFVLAGASAVQLGTVVFHDPSAPSRVSRELRKVLADRGHRPAARRHRPGPSPAADPRAREPDPVGDEPVEPEPVPHAVAFEEA